MAAKMIRVIATETGFDNLCIRNPGDEFNMPENVKGKWFHPVGAAPQAPAADVQGATPAPKRGAKKKTAAASLI